MCSRWRLSHHPHARFSLSLRIPSLSSSSSFGASESRESWRMLRGWFDAFRSDGGPTLYTFANRTPVTEDVRNVLIYVSFSTIFVAFLIVFPGIRKEKVALMIPISTMFRGRKICREQNLHVNIASKFRKWAVSLTVVLVT
ncbi:uncharacterized protein TNCV_4427071 [Trichonephila clavipes]|nr:uncharacterized protein TNCV_4427071 [Trichonephila clavipes]